MKIRDLKVGDKVRYQLKGRNSRIGIIESLRSINDSRYPFKVTVRSSITNKASLLRPIEVLEVL